MKNCLSIMFVSVIVLLSGCASSVPKADKEHDLQAKAFVSKSNRSNIYYYVENNALTPVNYGGDGDWEFIIDKEIVGAINTGEFIYFEVEPGTHRISSRLNAVKSAYQSEIAVDMDAGGNYFFVQGNSSVGARHYSMFQDDEATGKNEVLKCNLVLIPENVAIKVTRASSAASSTSAKQNQLKATQPNFASPDKINVPQPIAGNSGKYMSPYTAAGTLTSWAEKRAPVMDGGSDLAANVGGVVGQQVTSKALEFVPFGLGGLIGRSAGESAGRAATRKNIEPELPSMDTVRASSNISFKSVDELAVYMYAKNSTHSQYTRVLALTKTIYPELQQIYSSAIEKASQSQDKISRKQQSSQVLKKEKSVSKRLESLQVLKQKGLITEADFEAKKNKILESI